MQKLLSKNELKEIESAIGSAEQKTSGEIVVLMVASSHDYWWIHWCLSVFAIAMVTVGLFFYDVYTWFDLEILRLISFQVVAGVLGWLLGYWDGLKRLLIPRKWLERQVERQCRANFVSAGLTETRDRTGVLIYLSILEHRVRILADRGIFEKTPEGYWDQQIQTIVTGLKSGSLKEGLIKAVGNIGKKLSEDFPRKGDDQNELRDHVLLGHQDWQ